MASDDIALRKRQQIAKANRTMFLWVAGASVVVGVAAVFSIFLFQKLVFNQRVIGAKMETASILAANVETIPKLQDEIRALSANEALLGNRAKQDDTAVQVVLDALPSSENNSALGASLQRVLLDVDGVSLESLSVGADSEDSAVSASGNGIPFTFAVSANSGDGSKLLELLQRLERSIRAIDVQNVSVEMGGNKITMTVQASASYEPAKTVDLGTETIKP